VYTRTRHGIIKILRREETRTVHETTVRNVNYNITTIITVVPELEEFSTINVQFHSTTLPWSRFNWRVRAAVRVSNTTCIFILYCTGVSVRTYVVDMSDEKRRQSILNEHVCLCTRDGIDRETFFGKFASVVLFRRRLRNDVFHL